MILLRSALFYVFFWTWNACFLTLCLPLIIAPPAVTYRLGRLWVRVILLGLRIICGLEYELRGLEHLPKPPYLLASKHQSAWDTLIIALLDGQPSLVLKAELILVPIFGWFLARAGMIPVDRAGGAKALKAMLAKARPVRDQGRPIVIFPEGTRTPVGQKRPYHPGVAALYKDLGIPVAPVALNSGLFWARRSFLKRPGRILFEVLPAIEPGLDRKVFLARLQDRIEEASERLRQEAEERADASRAALSGRGMPQKQNRNIS